MALPLRLIFLLPLLSLFFLSCEKDEHAERAEKERKQILEYIEENNLDAYEHESGIFIVVAYQGSGSTPREDSTVRMKFNAFTLKDEKMFYSTYDEFVYLPNEPMGFRLGVMEFTRGGKGVIFVPSALGYGPYSNMYVDRNAVLKYEIEIIDFN